MGRDVELVAKESDCEDAVWSSRKAGVLLLTVATFGSDGIELCVEKADTLSRYRQPTMKRRQVNPLMVIR